MISMDCPDLNVDEVFRASISRVRDPALKARLAAITGDLTTAAADYVQKARNNRLHEFPRDALVGAVTTVEMEKVYTQRMAKKTGLVEPTMMRFSTRQPNACSAFIAR